MYIDYKITDPDTNEAETKELVKELCSFKLVNSITAPHYLLKSIKNTIDTKDISLSCVIDYPLGFSDLRTRLTAIESAIKIGIDMVDIVMPQNLAANRKYDKIREDIKNCLDICSNNNIEPRYILEYRVFDHHCLKKICEILDSFGIKKVFPSTGYFLDNLADNLIASSFLYQNSKDLEIICSANIWNNKHFELINKANIYGIRISYIEILRNFLSYNLK
jgi:deoxyribose-phosphate aldolase